MFLVFFKQFFGVYFTCFWDVTHTQHPRNPVTEVVDVQDLLVLRKSSFKLYHLANVSSKHTKNKNSNPRNNQDRTSGERGLLFSFDPFFDWIENPNNSSVLVTFHTHWAPGQNVHGGLLQTKPPFQLHSVIWVKARSSSPNLRMFSPFWNSHLKKQQQLPYS